VVYGPGDESLPVVVRLSAIVFVGVVSGGGHRPTILTRIVLFPRRPATAMIAVRCYYITTIIDYKYYLLHRCVNRYPTTGRQYNIPDGFPPLSCARRRQLHNNNINMVLRRIRPGRANDGERLRRDDAKRRRACGTILLQWYKRVIYNIMRKQFIYLDLYITIYCKNNENN